MGADLVYTEEMVGFKVSTLTRHYDGFILSKNHRRNKINRI